MKKSLLLAAASLAAISCSKREMGTNPYAPDPNEVIFSSGAADVVPGSKVTVDQTKGSIFEVNDEIGIYAVLDGKKIDESDAFPTNTAVQYKNKTYKVASVEEEDPYEASFTATDNDNKIYYLPGGQAYNYYAYFPTSSVSDVNMSASTFSYEETSNDFANQTALFSQDNMSLVVTPAEAYPGPMMYAYYKTADKAATNGGANTPVNLEFKYANAKLSLAIEMDQAAGNVEDITSIELYAKEGLYQGYTFDLKQADETSPAVVKQGSANKLDGSGSGRALQSYQFQNLIDNKSGATTTSHVTGYLIPATGIQDAVIRITTGSNKSAEVFKARLDKSTTGENVSSGENYLPTIEAGKEYKFKIKITKKEVQFTGTIEDWVPVDKTGTVIPAE
ncbi:fimbrillin family protein [Rikenella microfusus]|uniref:fimbrillin family protein n=1 Tax=Rikenella microfusus TaxID=28139 RepID=UPI00248ECD53|nr:fimbrillin family protein [Rikenella microfusus]